MDDFVQQNDKVAILLIFFFLNFFFEFTQSERGGAKWLKLKYPRRGSSSDK